MACREDRLFATKRQAVRSNRRGASGEERKPGCGCILNLKGLQVWAGVVEPALGTEERRLGVEARGVGNMLQNKGLCQRKAS